jgi:hypothetical protein
MFTTDSMLPVLYGTCTEGAVRNSMSAPYTGQNLTVEQGK